MPIVKLRDERLLPVEGVDVGHEYDEWPVRWTAVRLTDESSVEHVVLLREHEPSQADERLRGRMLRLRAFGRILHEKAFEQFDGMIVRENGAQMLQVNRGEQRC